MYDMGRRVPIENLSLIHPVIYFSFVAAGFAASMAIITALCGFRRKSPSSSLSQPSSSDPLESGKDLDSSMEPENNNDNTDEEEQAKGLPLPPAMVAMQHPKEPFISEKMKRVTSERKMPLSLSIKMPRSMSVARNWDQKEKEEKIINKGNIGGKLKAEDSVWMKTIILGEKCVPDEGDDPVIYEGKGKRIAAYHTKRHSTMSMHKQTSFLDPDALSLSIPEIQIQIQTQTHTQDTQNERNNNTLSS